MIRAEVALCRRAEPALLARVRLRSRRRVLWLRHLWAASQEETAQGLAIPHGEVDRLLAGADREDEEAAFGRADPEARALAEPIDDADREAAAEPPWPWLCEQFGLTGADVDLLMLLVALEIDPGLRRVCGYLNDDAAACHATPFLAAALFGRPVGGLVGPGSALVRWRLARPSDVPSPWSPAAPWAVDSFVVALVGQALAGEPCTAEDPALAGAARLLGPDVPAVCVYPAQLAALRDFVVGAGAGGDAEVELTGPEGAGKRTLAAQLCAALGLRLVVADARELLGGDVPPALAAERAAHAVRLARLHGAALYWHDAGAVPPRAWAKGHGRPMLTLYGSTGPLTRPREPDVARRWVALPPLTRAGRRALWRALSPSPVPEPVAEWMLTPADIAAAARAAAAGPEAVAEACRPTLAGGPADLIAPLPCPYAWDDLILPPHVREHLRELANQARQRWAVYEDWGFGRLCPLGRGITALFAGPSGTGKTMAAQVLARDLGLDLYRLDLANVVSKYIGETEKNLKQVFDRCQRANVLLFFDEADALFGRRTQVKDAHDRFANIEIDYLLQRMEQFDGLAVLATNRKADIDTAFLRRLRFVIDFLAPGPPERRELWRRALLPRSPAGEELLDAIDFDLLANKLTMTGADVKAAALGAAFLARQEGRRIGMAHVLRAARRELNKHGTALPLADLERMS
jgi:AAA+ superfamily predicted ATPase